MLFLYMKRTLKRYEYRSKDGIKWTNWFPSMTRDKQEYQFYDRRISSRLKNEYKDEESLCNDC